MITSSTFKRLKVATDKLEKEKHDKMLLKNKTEQSCRLVILEEIAEHRLRLKDAKVSDIVTLEAKLGFSETAQSADNNDERPKTALDDFMCVMIWARKQVIAANAHVCEDWGTQDSNECKARVGRGERIQFL